MHMITYLLCTAYILYTFQDMTLGVLKKTLAAARSLSISAFNVLITYRKMKCHGAVMIKNNLGNVVWE